MKSIKLSLKLLLITGLITGTSEQNASALNYQSMMQFCQNHQEGLCVATVLSGLTAGLLYVSYRNQGELEKFAREHKQVVSQMYGEQQGLIERFLNIQNIQDVRDVWTDLRKIENLAVLCEVVRNYPSRKIAQDFDAKQFKTMTTLVNFFEIVDTYKYLFFSGVLAEPYFDMLSLYNRISFDCASIKVNNMFSKPLQSILLKMLENEMHHISSNSSYVLQKKSAYKNCEQAERNKEAEDKLLTKLANDLCMTQDGFIRMKSCMKK